MGWSAPGTLGSSQQAAPNWAHGHTEQAFLSGITLTLCPSLARPHHMGEGVPTLEEAGARARARPSTRLVESMDMAPEGRAQGKDDISVLGPSATKPYG